MTGKGIQKLRVVEAVDADTAEPEPEESAEMTSLQAMVEEINQLLNALAGYGVDLRDIVIPSQIRPRIESLAACKMLMLKGVCSEEEMQAMQTEIHREFLRGFLQVAEQQRLQQQQDLRKIIAPESPKGLVIARH